MKATLFRLPLISALAACTAAPLFAGPPPKPNPKISNDAAALPQDSLVNVIVQYRHSPGAVQEGILAVHGGLLKNTLRSIHAQTATLPQSELENLAKDPDVTHISLDHPVAARGGTGSTNQMTQAEYTTEPINAPQVWAKGYNGTGVGVAVIDSGITPVDDLSLLVGLGSRVVYSQNFVPDSNGVVGPNANDTYGHGTHVAGLIAGNGSDSTGLRFYRTFSGAAPNANLINLRVLDGNGAGSDSTVIAGIERAIALKNTYNIKVINLSLGRPIWESYTVDPLCQAVEQAWKAGIVVVVAAGNDGRDQNWNSEGYGTIEAPGNDPYVITVGAMNTKGTAALADDVIGSYSSKGPSFIDQVSKPDLVAPGNLVSSLYFPNDPLASAMPNYQTLNGFYMSNGPVKKVSSSYLPLSGTSMAAGVVSGGVALLEQAAPGLSPDQIKALLMKNANHGTFPQVSSVTDPGSGIVYKANYDAFTVGAGYLDVNAALTDYNSGTQIPSGTAMSPIASYNASTGGVTLVPDASSLWSNTILWGASNIYGANAFVGGSNALWSNTILWGAGDPAGFTTLWSNTILWGAGTPQAATILWGAGSPQAATILWGASDPSAQTILWGAGANPNYTF